MTQPQPFDDEMLARLSDYLDDVLASEERIALEAELSADPRLAAELAALRRVDDLVRTTASAVPDIDWARFTADARATRTAASARPSGHRRGRVLRPVAAAAVLALLVTAAAWWRVADRPTTPQTVVEVSVERIALTASVATASVSRTPPPDAIVTAGPMPRGRTLIVTVATDLHYTNGANDVEDDAAFF